MYDSIYFTVAILKTEKGWMRLQARTDSTEPRGLSYRLISCEVAE